VSEKQNYQLRNMIMSAKNGGSAINVTSASKEVVAVNASRIVVTVTNLSLTQMLTLNLGGTAVSGAGIVLSPASDATHPGGRYTVYGVEYAGQINGIMSGADATANNVAIVEV
jgi:hypothetical protein